MSINPLIEGTQPIVTSSILTTENNTNPGTPLENQVDNNLKNDVVYILKFYQSQNKPLTVKEIVDIFATQGKTVTTKDLNPILYSLLAAKQVIKLDPTGSSKQPRWTYNSQGELLQQKIIQLLQENTEMETLQIAKAVGFGTRKEINPTLYAMEKSKLISKVSENDGSKPRWHLHQ